jgi:hypothetical protein
MLRAFLNLVYREPALAAPRLSNRLRSVAGEKQACRTMVGLLALAHNRACDAQLAAINAELNRDRLPDLDTIGRRFTPNPSDIPDVTVEVAPLQLWRPSVLRRSTIIFSW